LGEVVKLGAAVECVDGVSARKDKPVIGSETGKCRVESVKGCRRGNLDGGDEDGDGPQSLELGGKLGGLMAGSGNEDVLLVEGHLG
jgi:hypothetical protein